MKYVILFLAVIIAFARLHAESFPDMLFEDKTVTITIIDMNQITTADLSGFVTIDLRNFTKLHFKKDLFQVISEEMNNLTAVQALPQEIEIMPGKKVNLIVIRFRFNINKNLARGIFKN
jgi:hypothetical protein